MDVSVIVVMYRYKKDISVCDFARGSCLNSNPESATISLVLVLVQEEKKPVLILLGKVKLGMFLSLVAPQLFSSLLQ